MGWRISFWGAGDASSFRRIWRISGCCSWSDHIGSIALSFLVVLGGPDRIGGTAGGTGVAGGIAGRIAVAGDWDIAEEGSLLAGIGWSFLSAVLFTGVGWNGLCFGCWDWNWGS